LLLINFKFINTHNYGIYYPNDIVFFGQFGMYMYLLTISLIVQKKYKIYMYPFLFNIFAHPPWAIFTLISLIIIKVNTKIKFFFSKANFIFLLVLILMNIIFYYQNTSFGLYNFNFLEKNCV
jgi:hypothetical protein